MAAASPQVPRCVRMRHRRTLWRWLLTSFALALCAPGVYSQSCQFYPLGENRRFERVSENIQVGTRNSGKINKKSLPGETPTCLLPHCETQSGRPGYLRGAHLTHGGRGLGYGGHPDPVLIAAHPLDAVTDDRAHLEQPGPACGDGGPVVPDHRCCRRR
ncbi:hypothetical protein MRX96_036123 [Rhipicephalus microplus]